MYSVRSLSRFGRSRMAMCPAPSAHACSISGDVHILLPPSEREDKEPQRRQYHTTPKNNMFLYAAIGLFSAAGYVVYKKYNGEPLKPKSATAGQSAYQKMEEDRLRRNKVYEERRLEHASKGTKD